MSNSDDNLKMLAAKGSVEAINSANSRNESSEVRLILVLIGIIVFLGHDAVKLVFRKNFGVTDIGIIRFLLLTIIFLTIGIMLLINENENYGFSEVTPMANKITGAAYIFLASYILYLGIRHLKTSLKYQLTANHKGQPGLLSFLDTQYKWRENSIKYFAEPFYVLFIASLFYFYNPIGAIPIAICAISVWIYPVVKKFFPEHLDFVRNNNHSGEDEYSRTNIN